MSSSPVHDLQKQLQNSYRQYLQQQQQQPSSICNTNNTYPFGPNINQPQQQQHGIHPFPFAGNISTARGIQTSGSPGGSIPTPLSSQERAAFKSALLGVDEDRIDQYYSNIAYRIASPHRNTNRQEDKPTAVSTNPLPPPYINTSTGGVVTNNKNTTTNDTYVTASHKNSIDTYFDVLGQLSHERGATRRTTAETPRSTRPVPSSVHIDPFWAAESRHGYKSRLASCPLYRPPRAGGAPASPPRSQNFTGDFRYYKRNVLDNVRSHFHAAATAAQQNKHQTYFGKNKKAPRLIEL